MSKMLTDGDENELPAFYLGPLAFGLLSQNSALVAQHYFVPLRSTEVPRAN